MNKVRLISEKEKVIMLAAILAAFLLQIHLVEAETITSRDIQQTIFQNVIDPTQFPCSQSGGILNPSDIVVREKEVNSFHEYIKTLPF